MNAVTLRTSLLSVALGCLAAATSFLRADTVLPETGRAAAAPHQATAPVAAVAASAEGAAPTPFTRDILVATLTRTLAAHFNLEGDLQLELIRAWTPPGRVATGWDVQILEFPALPASSMMMRCRVLADGAVAAETSFVVRAQLWRDVWATRQPLAAGAIFDVAALETRRVDVLRERDALPAAVGDRNSIFARAVPAGRMLTWRDIARRPLVKKGEIVEVSASDGPLIVTMKAVAMENGAHGDTVTVRNPESRKDFAAMVVEENRVQVRF